ncbi:MAG: ABC transporter substrate-binding protein [Acidimicrobiales bacterium]
MRSHHRPTRGRALRAGLAAAVAATAVAASLASLAAAGTTATGAASLPACPLAALRSAKGTVDIDFWESMKTANATTLQALTSAFNGSQHKVHVTLVQQGSYTTTWLKFQAGLSNHQLPALAQLTQTALQGAIDTRAILPAQSCIKAAHYATKDYVPRILSYYKVDGVQQALPFAVSGPVVYYNKQAFTAAGLDPTTPPATLPAYMADAKALTAHGSGTGLVLDAWHLETWLATADKLFVNQGNGRRGRATRAVFDNATGRLIWTDLDRLVSSGDAVTNPSTGTDAVDNLLGMGTGKYGMTIDSSADLGTISELLSTHPNVTLGVGPLPVLGTKPVGGVEPGGSALYLSSEVPAVQQAAAWQYETFLDSPASQATWAAGTGYIPVRKSSVTTPTIKNLWRTDPGFKVAYTQLVHGPTTLATSGAVIGPYATVRKDVLTAEESMYQSGVSPATALRQAAKEVGTAIASYNQRVSTS